MRKDANLTLDLVVQIYILLSFINYKLSYRNLHYANRLLKF